MRTIKMYNYPGKLLSPGTKQSFLTHLFVNKGLWLALLLIAFCFAGCATETPSTVTRIPPPPPKVEKKPIEVGKVVYTVQRGDTVYRIAKAHGVSPKSIIKTNQISDVRSLQPGQKIIIPGVKNPIAYAPPTTVGKPKGSFIWPVRGDVISNFGDDKNGLRNTGIDISAKPEQNVVAVRGGVVLTTTVGIGGKVLVIKHQPGLNSWYGHIGRILVKKGSKVKQGQIIARVNNRSILHFKIFVNDRPVDPLGYLP